MATQGEGVNYVYFDIMSTMDGQIRQLTYQINQGPVKMYQAILESDTLRSCMVAMSDDLQRLPRIEREGHQFVVFDHKVELYHLWCAMARCNVHTWLNICPGDEVLDLWDYTQWAGAHTVQDLKKYLVLNNREHEVSLLQLAHEKMRPVLRKPSMASMVIYD